MKNYIIKRILLIPLTLLGILTVNFCIIQLAPGGPVEYMLAKYQGMNVDSKAQFTATAPAQHSSGMQKYQGAQGVPDDLVEALEKQFGFDKPWHERFLKMIKEYAVFDFGRSYYRDKSVAGLIAERMPVSVSLGLWSTLIIYLISIPLGIKKALCKVYKVLNLSDISVTHSCRHTFASMLYAVGVPDKIIQKQLGHASVSTTMDVYTDILMSGSSPVLDYVKELKSTLISTLLLS